MVATAMRDEEESIELDGLAKQLDDASSKEGSAEPLAAGIAVDGEGAADAADDEDVHQSRVVPYYLVCLLMGSMMTALSKLAMKETDEFIVMFFRMGGTFIIAMIYMVYTGVEHLFWGPPGMRRILLARGFVGTLNLALVYYSVQFIPLPDYSLITFLGPQLTALAAHFILHEPYHWMQAVASGVSFLGVVIMTRPSFIFGEHIELPEGVTPRQHAVAVFCVLLQVLGSTTIFLLLRKIGTRISAHTIVSHYALQTCVFSAGALLVKVLYLKERMQVPTQARTWVLLVFIGLVGFSFQFLMSLAIARGSASVLTQYDYLVVIYYLLWQYVLFHTLPDSVSLGGGTLIVAGVLWMARFRARLADSR